MVWTPSSNKDGSFNTSQLYGTAGLARGGPHSLKDAFATSGYGAVLMGCNADKPETGLLWNPAAGLGHALTFGATRSGKNVGAIIPALLTYNGSAVVIDPKGENSWVTAPRRRAMGQRVVILDPWGEVNRRYAAGAPTEQITRFNPLSVLDPADSEFADDVALLADALITPSGGDTHWTDSARELLAGLIAAVVERRPGTATLRDVRRLILLDQTEFAAAIAIFEAGNPDGLGSRKLASFKVANREVDSIRSTARTQTAFLESTSLADGMETDDPAFDLAELATGWTTLYLVLPVDRLQSHGRWLRLVLTLALRAIARQPIPPANPVLFLLDEMGTVGRLSMVEQAFGLMAGLGVRLWGFLQDLNQMKRDYPESWETFIANSAVIQILNARDQTTCEYFSEYFGRMTIYVASAEGDHARDYKNRIRKIFLLRDIHYAHDSDNRITRPTLYPDEIRRMGNDYSIVCYTNDHPCLIEKVSYWSDPRLRQHARSLPQFVNSPVKALPGLLGNLVKAARNIATS